mgnify:FL=1
MDLVIDSLGAVGSADPTTAAINSLKRRGTCVFCGGVGVDIPVSYGMMLFMEWNICGSFMYEAEVPRDLLKLIASGVIDTSGVCNILA